MSDVQATQTEQVNLTPAEQQAIEAVAEQLAPAVTATGAAIDAWFNRQFNDSVVARNTEIFNYVRVAVEALKTELAG